MDSTLSAMSPDTAMSSTLTRSQKLQNCFLQTLLGISELWLLRNARRFQIFWAWAYWAKYWPVSPAISLVRLSNGPTTALKNYYRISRKRRFYQSTLVRNISLSKWAFLNSEHRILSPLPVYEIVHHILIVVNVQKKVMEDINWVNEDVCR